jgi:ABC-type phosphate transport system substrate-binding protein
MKLIQILLLVFATLLVNSTCIFAEEAPRVVIQKQVELTALEQSELVRIFTRKKVFWPSGQKISVFIKPQNSLEHKIFSINILNLTPYKYKSLTDSIVYSGANNPPTEVDSDEQMLSILARTPNSIGYVNYSIIINNDNQLITIKVE